MLLIAGRRDQAPFLAWIEHDPETTPTSDDPERQPRKGSYNEELGAGQRKAGESSGCDPMRDSLPPTWQKLYDDWFRKLGSRIIQN